MSFSKNDIGIDLGTANTLVYHRGKGIVLNEPSVVAMDINANKIIAVGKRAAEMVGRTPGNIVAKKPLMDGVIASDEATQEMLDYYLNEALKGKRSFSGRVAICVPCGASSVERMAVTRAAECVGIKSPYLIEEPLAAAIGAGISCDDPRGRMIVDIGGGTTDVAVVSDGGIVASESIQVAGKSFDEDILSYLRREHRVSIGERTAEEIKIKIGAAFPRPKTQTMPVRGIDVVSGWPTTASISSTDVIFAIADNIKKIAVVIKRVFERTPPELAVDIKKEGIMLVGGGSLLFGIDRAFSELVGLRVFVANNPLDCVAIGTGMCFDKYDEKIKRSKRQSKNVEDLHDEKIVPENEIKVAEKENVRKKEKPQKAEKDKKKDKDKDKEKVSLLDKLVRMVADIGEGENK